MSGTSWSRYEPSKLCAFHSERSRPHHSPAVSEQPTAQASEEARKRHTTQEGDLVKLTETAMFCPPRPETAKAGLKKSTTSDCITVGKG